MLPLPKNFQPKTSNLWVLYLEDQTITKLKRLAGL
jgi:hypothetical protein